MPQLQTHGAFLGLDFLFLIRLGWTTLHGLSVTIFVACGVAVVFALDCMLSVIGLDHEWLAGQMHGNADKAAQPTTAAQKKRMKSALLIAMSLAAHNAPEGLAVGMTSVAHPSQTLLMAVAMALHNIPEVCGYASTCRSIHCSLGPGRRSWLAYSHSYASIDNLSAVVDATGNKPRAIAIATATGLVEPVSAVLSVAVMSQFLTMV